MSVTFPIEFFLHQNKIQTVLTGKYASKYPVKTVSKPLLEFSCNQNFDGSVKIFDIFFLLSYTALRFSMQTFLGKNQPIVRKRFDFEKRNKLTWNALSECFALANFQFRDQKINSPHLTNPIDVKLWYEIIFGRNQCSTSSHEEKCVQKTVITKLNYVRHISHNHDFDGSIERFDISSLFFITTLKFLM